ncbi:hypothetical protein AAG570_007993 [Ranatra chinensis]|uniref:NFACT RNA-binding domain-containing protein n=1 Tax=Ranatra chinensis TaxID=642074 RepID=A0ABD0YHC2_9HEMI
MRVVQVYDIDNKTYLFKLNRSEEKAVLLLESGIRFHTTQYDWPKNIAPSGFSMKMRKHLRNKRLEHICQIGVDRIVDLHFGSGEATYHVILELFDRGNILLTDFTYTILSVLRPHKEGDKFRFAVKEKYPIDRARQESESPSEQFLKDILLPLKEGSSVRKALLPHLEYGSSLLEHVLLMAGFSKYPIMHKDFTLPDIENLAKYCLLAEEIVYMAHKGLLSTGYIIKKKIERINQEDLLKNEEFHPYLFKQHADDLFETFDSFSSAVDEFFSNLEAQKQELKANQITDDALRKVERIREDQQSRLKELNLKQETKVTQAELITHNYKLVDAAIMAVRSALAAQMSWEGIEYLVNDAASKNDPVASIIKKLKLETNHITVLLSDSCIDSEDSERELTQMLVDIDLDLSAHANAKRYYVDKKSAAVKQQKTIESQEKALKSAHKKAMVVMKEVKTMNTISKARKTYWFEKFYWFITSENYLVIGGRDQQQNELIVKRYMRDGDIYVHADIVGASSIIIKNPTGSEVPPKTLNEAGTMAICYSAGWAAKVVCSSWWVHANQVSKTAPTGEYLTTGSFMIRGKKNYLPQSILAMGFTFLFRTDESSAVR